MVLFHDRAKELGMATAKSECDLKVWIYIIVMQNSGNSLEDFEKEWVKVKEKHGI